MTPADSTPSSHGDSAAKGKLRTLARVPQAKFEIGFFRAILSRSPDYVDVLRCLGDTLSREGMHGDALEVDRRLAQLRPHDAVVHYNFACSLALGGARVEAIGELRAALENGYDDLEHLESDSDLDTLRDEPEYRRLMRDYGLLN